MLDLTPEEHRVLQQAICAHGDWLLELAGSSEDDAEHHQAVTDAELLAAAVGKVNLQLAGEGFHATH